jgi:hypothetical protein
MSRAGEAGWAAAGEGAKGCNPAAAAALAPMNERTVRRATPGVTIGSCDGAPSTARSGQRDQLARNPAPNARSDSPWRSLSRRRPAWQTGGGAFEPFRASARLKGAKEPSVASLPVFGHEEQEQAPRVGIQDRPGGESCRCVAAFGRIMTHSLLWFWWSASSRSRPGWLASDVRSP